MFLKNKTEFHVSLFGGGLLIRAGDVQTITQSEFDSREITDAIRRGWVEVVDSLEAATPVAPKEIPLETPSELKSMTPEEVKTASAPKKRGPKPADAAPAEGTDATA